VEAETAGGQRRWRHRTAAGGGTSSKGANRAAGMTAGRRALLDTRFYGTSCRCAAVAREVDRLGGNLGRGGQPTRSNRRNRTRPGRSVHRTRPVGRSRAHASHPEAGHRPPETQRTLFGSGMQQAHDRRPQGRSPQNSLLVWGSRTTASAGGAFRCQDHETVAIWRVNSGRRQREGVWSKPSRSCKTTRTERD